MIAFFAILVFSNSAYAAAATWSQTGGAGTTVQIGTGTNNLTFDPSPGVLITGASDISVYCIISGNIKAGSDAIAYSVASGSGAVGQDAISLSATSTVSDLGTPDTNGGIASGFTTK